MDRLADMQETAVAYMGLRPVDVLEMTPGEYAVALSGVQARLDGEREFLASMTAAVMTALGSKGITADRLLGPEHMLRRAERDARHPGA